LVEEDLLTDSTISLATSNPQPIGKKAIESFFRASKFASEAPSALAKMLNFFN
jgi:hypothetical protein